MTAVLDHGRDTRYWRLFGPTTITEWWKLRVRAMASDEAGEWREAVILATTYNDRPSWWIEYLEE